MTQARFAVHCTRGRRCHDATNLSLSDWFDGMILASFADDLCIVAQCDGLAIILHRPSIRSCSAWIGDAASRSRLRAQLAPRTVARRGRHRTHASVGTVPHRRPTPSKRRSCDCTAAIPRPPAPPRRGTARWYARTLPRPDRADSARTGRLRDRAAPRRIGCARSPQPRTGGPSQLRRERADASSFPPKGSTGRRGPGRRHRPVTPPRSGLPPRNEGEVDPAAAIRHRAAAIARITRR